MILQRRTSCAKSDPSFTEYIFRMPFQLRKLPAIHQCSESKKQDIGVFTIMIEEVNVGKRAWWLA